MPKCMAIDGRKGHQRSDEVLARSTHGGDRFARYLA